ncbi:glycosyltransferase family 2 protein [Geomonas propionica]|uniref:Glycosyltransferase family 2 protein n=1 Tax=Geomonas propionica TaxID=2798582 RepID=A0ABS0YVJ2_9BACT|nr:glycosyltransferase family A protein [Geomonas propionica]MBJ6801934.1 glycosyltransferase family 2 protein [Geomonas propionica]
MLLTKSAPASAFATAPLVTIVLPVYNGARYLREAIDSILGQTFCDFELIVINDGSRDDSSVIAQQYDDPRIRFYTQDNIGLAATLNRGIGLARGRYLARQDQDDISKPDRLERQVRFLEQHPEYGMVGTRAAIWVEGEASPIEFLHPCENEGLRFRLLFNNPFVHSSMMIRMEVFAAIGTYCTDKSRQPPEDYELWSRVTRRFKVGNLPEVLHVYRETGSSMSRTGINPFLEKVVRISSENLRHTLGDTVSQQNVGNLAALYNGAFELVQPPVRPVALGGVLLRALVKVGGPRTLALLWREGGRSLAKLYGRYFLYLSFRVKAVRTSGVHQEGGK